MAKEKQTCPTCGYLIDAHTATDESEDKPQPNDISICFKCGAWNKFNQDLKIVTLPTEERDMLDEHILLEMEKISGRIQARNRTVN